MRFSITTLTLATLLAGFTACNDGGSDVTAKAIEGEAAAETPVNAKPEKFDPAQTQAEAPAGPTTAMVFDSYEHDFGTMDEGHIDFCLPC